MYRAILEHIAYSDGEEKQIDNFDDRRLTVLTYKTRKKNRRREYSLSLLVTTVLFAIIYETYKRNITPFSYNLNHYNGRKCC